MNQPDEPEVSTLAQRSVTRSFSVGALVQPLLDSLASETPSEGYVRTGFADLDLLTLGIGPGELWLLTGRSGVGKSVLATDLLRSCALHQDRRALLLSRGENPESVARRALCAEARIPLHHMQPGQMTDQDWARLPQRKDQVASAPLSLARANNLNVEAVEAILRADRSDADDPVHLLVIDDVPAGPDQMQTLSCLEALARTRRMAVVAVVQEDIDQSQWQLRHLEQLADVMIRVHRDDQETVDSPRIGEADLIVTRNRRGPVGRMVVHFQGHYGRFVDPARIR